MTIAVAQHNVEIHANAAHWERKPLLRKIYADFYGTIAHELRRDLDGQTVEIGAGIGNLKTVLPETVATDIFPNPWLDQTENAFALTFADESVANLILFDVWHHLEYPGTALAEFARVLKPGGRLAVFDPAMGALGRLVYGVFHHEPLGLGDKIRWEAPEGFAPETMRYYAAQGNAQRVFFTDEFSAELSAWKFVRRRFFSGLAYAGSGGFRGPQLYPDGLYPLLKRMDSIADALPSLSATRLLAVLEKL